VPALGTRLVSSLRRSDCRELVTVCRAKGLKATTVRGIARTLSTILSQAVDDELLPANPALRLGKYLRTADDPEPAINPFTKNETALILAVARARFPDWYPWLLCGLRTGMRLGELWRCNGARSTGAPATFTYSAISRARCSRRRKIISAGVWTCPINYGLFCASGDVRNACGG